MELNSFSNLLCESFGDIVIIFENHYISAIRMPRERIESALNFLRQHRPVARINVPQFINCAVNKFFLK